MKVASQGTRKVQVLAFVNLAPRGRTVHRDAMPDRCILVVDDEHAITSVLATALELQGYTVEVAESAQAAGEKLQDKFIQLAVIDVMMPGEPGTSLAQRAQERGIAVVLMSGEPQAIEELPASGFSYLQKPFRLAELMAAVETALHASDAA